MLESVKLTTGSKTKYVANQKNLPQIYVEAVEVTLVRNHPVQIQSHLNLRHRVHHRRLLGVVVTANGGQFSTKILTKATGLSPEVAVMPNFTSLPNFGMVLSASKTARDENLHSTRKISK